jgi:hypothetical protein
MLARLSGRTHEVLTAVALVTPEPEVRLSRSRVTFRPIEAAERLAYWESGEPVDKAGAYGIQGLGAIFVARLEGSYSGVMGLPLFETAALLAEAGIHPAGSDLCRVERLRVGLKPDLRHRQRWSRETVGRASARGELQVQAEAI